MLSMYPQDALEFFESIFDVMMDSNKQQQLQFVNIIKDLPETSIYFFLRNMKNEFYQFDVEKSACSILNSNEDIFIHAYPLIEKYMADIDEMRILEVISQKKNQIGSAQSY